MAMDVMPGGIPRQELPFVVGAYASQPQDEAGQVEYYDMLAGSGWVDGLEVPFPGQLADTGIAAVLGKAMGGRFRHSVLTPIPGTMVNVWKDPLFGLASPDADGRARAVSFLRGVRDAAEDFQARFGETFRWVAVHSAPTNVCEPEAFAESLGEITGWDWGGAELVIEHCDEAVVGICRDGVVRTHTPEKGFLLLCDEITVARELGVGVSLNWGRSAVGSRGDVVPGEHVVQAAEAGVLRGVMFSGASPQETVYGGPWADGHLPSATDEPLSLMTEAIIDECAARAVGAGYLGAKCCVPEGASLPRRLEMLEHIHRAAVGMPAA